MKKTFFFSVIFLMMASVCIHAQQATRDDLQKEKKQLEKEIDDLNNALAANKNKKKQSLGQLVIVQRKIATRERLINNINKDIHHLDDDIYAKELERNHLKKELDTLKQNYAKSIVFAYKNRGSYEYLNFLFSATDFNDALKRMTYLKSYRQYRETQAQTILQTQTLLQDKIVSLNGAIDEHKHALETQGKQLKVLEDDKKEKDLVVKQLLSREKDLTGELKKREKARQQLNLALEAAFKKAQKEAEDNARLAKRNDSRTAPSMTPNTSAKSPKNNEPVSGMVTANDNPAGRVYNVFESTPEGLTRSINFENNKGRLPWPVSGGVVTNFFGKHAIPGMQQMKEDNSGIFIATEVGASVKCVADGEVSMVFDLGDFQAVFVQHGKYFTVYNKLSQVAVSKGQAVKAGTLLGKAAEDFDGGGKIEFRVMTDKNQYIDPERWLKSR